MEFSQRQFRQRGGLQAGNAFGRVNVVVDAQRGEFYLVVQEIAPASGAEMSPLQIVAAAEMLARRTAGEVCARPEPARQLFPRAAEIARLAEKSGGVAPAIWSRFICGWPVCDSVGESGAVAYWANVCPLFGRGGGESPERMEVFCLWLWHAVCLTGFVKVHLNDSRVLPGGSRPRGCGWRRRAGMTLVEVVMALAIVALVFGGIIEGYVTSGKMTEWSGYSLAAQSVGVQVLEQVRSATWDPTLNKCEVTNMPLLGSSLQYSAGSTWTNYSGYVTNILDVPWNGNNFVVVTNFVNFRVVSFASNTNVQMILARVDTVWPFNEWGNFQSRIYTNTVCTYLAPDNPDSSTLGK